MDVLFAIVLMGYGIYSVLLCFFPRLRSSDFGHWETRDGNETTISILGFEKVIRPGKVIAEGMMSEKEAVRSSLFVGLLLIAIGFLAFRHTAGIPDAFPDVAGQLFAKLNRATSQ